MSEEKRALVETVSRMRSVLNAAKKLGKKEEKSGEAKEEVEKE